MVRGGGTGADCAMDDYRQRRWRAGIAAASGVFLFFLLPAMLLSVVAVHGVEDYCSTHPVFESLNSGSGSVYGPDFHGPFHIVCHNDTRSISHYDPRYAIAVAIIWTGLVALSLTVGAIVAGTDSRRRRTGPWDRQDW